MSNLTVHSEELNDFVNKYFVNMDFSDIDNIDEAYSVKVLSQVEKTIVSINSENYDDDDPVLWFNREICLRALVILTQIEYFAHTLANSGHIERAVILLARIVESFNKKVMEDPEIVKAIEENRLEEELEKHFPKEVLANNNEASRISSFAKMIEDVDPSELNGIPDYFEPIPDSF